MMWANLEGPTHTAYCVPRDDSDEFAYLHTDQSSLGERVQCFYLGGFVTTDQNGQRRMLICGSAWRISRKMHF